MSKNFPPADGATPNVIRRSYKAPRSALSDFHYSLRLQRTMDVDMYGFLPETNKVIWVLEHYSYRGEKNVTMSTVIANKLNVPLIVLRSDVDDYEHTKPISFSVLCDGVVIATRNNVTWKDLKKLQEGIAIKARQCIWEPHPTVKVVLC